MRATSRVGAVLALVVFLLGGAWYVAWTSTAQGQLEARPSSADAELAAMSPAERAFISEASAVAKPLGMYPADTLKLGYRVCDMRALPELQARDEIVKLSKSTGYEMTRTESFIFLYRVKTSGICAP